MMARFFVRVLFYFEVILVGLSGFLVYNIRDERGERDVAAAIK